MAKMTLSEELAWRGFVNQTTYKDHTALDSAPITFYFGVDPSADSMTIGNLAAAMMVRHFIDHGHRAILLVGGATGMIGDPDGKSEEREMKSLEEIAKNKEAIANQYRQVFAGKDFEIVDNYDWFKDYNYLHFLRDIGKHVPMSQMLQREFVQSRLGEDGAGISYAEFSYALIQGFDFLHLYREKGATLQVCGSDQWGNSIAGVELIRRIAGGEAHIWSVPLVINKSTGKKFGKSEDGAIWLDPSKTSAYKFYQFWLNVDDEGLEYYLKIYTLLTPEEIQDTMTEFNANRGLRTAQKRLAQEVTRLVHGQDTLDRVEKITEAIFGDKGLDQFTVSDYEALIAEVTPHEARLETPILEVLVASGIANSKSEARRLVQEGAIKLNGQKMTEVDHALSAGDFARVNSDTHEHFCLVRRGKNQIAVLLADW